MVFGRILFVTTSTNSQSCGRRNKFQLSLKENQWKIMLFQFVLIHVSRTIGIDLPLFMLLFCNSIDINDHQLCICFYSLLKKKKYDYRRLIFLSIAKLFFFNVHLTNKNISNTKLYKNTSISENYWIKWSTQKEIFEDMKTLKHTSFYQNYLIRH